MTKQCPCGSNKDYSQCCEPFLKGSKKPNTAEELMRSRYSAFVVNDMSYVEKTHDPETAKEMDWAANEKWAKDSEWLGLEIIQTQKGTGDENEGLVEFKAKYKSNGEEHIHHELSYFRKTNGTWYFVDGTLPKGATYKRTEAKIGRNDPCTCGSGKKFKKCCGAEA